jgi:hypothetical protein
MYPVRRHLSRDAAGGIVVSAYRQVNIMNATEYIAHLKQLYCSDQFFDRPIGIHSDHANGITRVLREAGIETPSEKEKRMMREGRVPVDADSIQQDIEMRVNDILNSSPMLRYKISRVPAVAFLPTGSFDAFAQNAPNGEPICIVDVKVINDLALFSRALVQGLEAETEDDLRKSVLLAVMSCLSVQGIVSEECDQLQKESANRLTASAVVFTTLMAQAMTSFVLSHELAHHALGHLTETRTLRMGPHSRTPNIDVLTRSQRDELAADHEGMKAFLQYWEGHLNLSDDFDWHQIAPLLAFGIIGIGEDESNRSHPPARVRAERIHETFKSHLRPSALVFYDRTVRPFLRTVTTNYHTLLPMIEKSTHGYPLCNG